MEQVFEPILASLEQTNIVRSHLREHRDVLSAHLRVAKRALAALHTETDLGAAAAVVRGLLKPVGPALISLEQALPDETAAFYTYCDMWYHQLHAVVMICVVLEFVMGKNLADEATVKRSVGVEFQLPTEDYLMGVCNAISELARLSMNRVVLRDYETPRRCVQFAKDVFEAFKLLNFRNGPLRKRYDGMKYDVKRLEEIVFDLRSFGILTDDERKTDPEVLREAQSPSA